MDFERISQFVTNSNYNKFIKKSQIILAKNERNVSRKFDIVWYMANIYAILLNIMI